MTTNADDEGTTERDFSIGARMVTLTRQQPTTAQAAVVDDVSDCVDGVVVEELPPTFVDRELGVVLIVREPAEFETTSGDGPGATRVDPNLRNVAALLLHGSDGSEADTERARPLPAATVPTSLVGGEPVPVERFIFKK